MTGTEELEVKKVNHKEVLSHFYQRGTGVITRKKEKSPSVVVSRF